jgi:hypothetical protein
MHNTGIIWATEGVVKPQKYTNKTAHDGIKKGTDLTMIIKSQSLSPLMRTI